MDFSTGVFTKHHEIHITKPTHNKTSTDQSTLKTKGRPKGTPSGGHDSTIGIDSAAASGSTSVDLQHCAFPMG